MDILNEHILHLWLLIIQWCSFLAARLRSHNLRCSGRICRFFVRGVALRDRCDLLGRGAIVRGLRRKLRGLALLSLLFNHLVLIM